MTPKTVTAKTGTAKTGTAKTVTAKTVTGRITTSVAANSRRRQRCLVSVGLAGALALSACGSGDPSASQDSANSEPGTLTTDTAVTFSDPCTNAEGSIVVYSGRNENLVGELYSEFTAQTGIAVEARYGDSGELAGQILTEGESSPADVFFSQDAGALGAIAARGLFSKIDSALLYRIP